MIELNHLTKNFGDLVAVDDLTLTVEPGEFFAVLGPNAAGKTTLIRVLAGLLKPTRGTARVAGFDIQKAPLEARRRLAYVPDFPFLYDKLTPLEFLRFTGQIFQMSEDRIQEASRELIPRFHLEAFVNKPIEGLSHGTRQRVAIVSALLHDPEVLVIDEPMVGLDPQHARVVKDVLKERTRQGATVLLSTHQLSVAEEMADRIGIMHEGRLVAVGTRDELRRRAGDAGPLEQVFLTLTGGAARRRLNDSRGNISGAVARTGACARARPNAGCDRPGFLAGHGAVRRGGYILDGILSRPCRFAAWKNGYWIPSLKTRPGGP